MDIPSEVFTASPIKLTNALNFAGAEKEVPLEGMRDIHNKNRENTQAFPDQTKKTQTARLKLREATVVVRVLMKTGAGLFQVKIVAYGCPTSSAPTFPNPFPICSLNQALLLLEKKINEAYP